MSNFAMVFPGQGSQAVGMLADLAPQYPIVEATFKQASDVLGYDLWDLVQNGSAEDLGQTSLSLNHQSWQVTVWVNILP